MNATPAMLPAQILLVRTTVLVIMDTWETERQAASQKVRLFTMSFKHQGSVLIIYMIQKIDSNLSN